MDFLMASDGPAWRRLGSDPPSLGSYGAAGSAFAGELRRGRLRLRWELRRGRLLLR